MTHQEVLSRLCHLMGEVASATNHAPHGPSDCFCKEGGFWDSPNYAKNPGRYQNDGFCVEFMEKAVRDALASYVPEEAGHAD